MCLLIVLTAVDPEYPIVVAGNRDEARDRKAAPPGLFVGQRRRILSPRDRREGGTWMGINDRGLFAGLTNVAGVELPPDARSRGELPHLALDNGTLEGAVDTVQEAVWEHAYGGFQLAISDGQEACVLRYDGTELEHGDVNGPIVISNEHRDGELHLPDLEATLDGTIDVEERFTRLRTILSDEGDRSGHRVLKLGGEYGTVSSSLIAARPGDPRALRWSYAPGPPTERDYRNYGNLARRLIEG